MKALPKIFSKTMFIAARSQKFPEPHYELDLIGYDQTTGSNPLGYIVLGTAEVTVDIPECNPIQAEIAAIEKARDQILAAANLQAQLMNERIQSLLCIEHSPS